MSDLMPLVQKYLNDKETSDSVEPENDPLTTAAGVALAGPVIGAAKALAEPAGELVGNELGAVGNNIKGLLGNPSTVPSYVSQTTEEAAVPEMSTPSISNIVRSGNNTFAPIPQQTVEQLQTKLNALGPNSASPQALQLQMKIQKLLNNQ